MATRVCLCASTISYPEGGGHAWVYLNWALGLRAAGADVSWFEVVSSRMPEAMVPDRLEALRSRLSAFDLDRSLAVCLTDGSSVPDGAGLDVVTDADLLVNLQYGLPAVIVRRFRRSALIDIDPGLLQTWMCRGEVNVAPHDYYFTTGETVGRSGSGIPETGHRWHYTAPVVALDAWPVTGSHPSAPFTTVSHWYADESMVDDQGQWYANSKRDGFLPFLDLPGHARQPLELAIPLDDDGERRDLIRRGWRIRDALEASGTHDRYRAYVQHSRGEFSCVKPSCVRFQNAWISDRTLCYLASGKPAVVQHTGPSRFLPDREGVLRFRTLDEAAECLDLVAADYDRHARAARRLAEALFDAEAVARRLLGQALA
jgi:hypothetical protein